MTCTNCGCNINIEEASFCPNCGAWNSPETQVATNPSSSKKNNKPNKTIIIVAIIVAITVLLTTLVIVFREPIADLFNKKEQTEETTAKNKDKIDNNQTDDANKNDVADNTEKVTDEEKLPPQGSYIDEDGNVHDVFVDENGDSYYVDEDGGKQEIAEEEIIPPPEYVEPEEDKSDISDELVEEDDVVIDSTSSAKVDADKRMQSYFNIIKTNKYTITGTMKQKDGTVTEFPLYYVRNNNDFYIEAQVPMEEGKEVTASIVYLNGTTYCAIPSMKVYYVLDSSEDVSDEFGTGSFSDEVISKYKFVESGTVVLNGKTYICDVYDMDGETHKYYYDSNNNLVRIEEIYSKNSYTILEIKSMSSTPDTSKLKKPTGIDITGMM